MGSEQGKPGKCTATKEEMDLVMKFPDGLRGENRRKMTRTSLTRYSILKRGDKDGKELKEKLEAKSLSQQESRAIACVVGNAVGDALGAPLEFSAVRYGSTELKDMGQEDVWNGSRYNRFDLKPGQWTDDAAMGLCIADSLLVHGGFNPRDLRLRFLNWWEFGYNNAFGYDEGRRWGNGSVGLGGNISQSMGEFARYGTEYTAAGTRKTSGNGSLMRNGAVPCRYFYDVEQAADVGYKQSKTTHQGDEAAECCRLLSHICSRAIQTKGKVDVKALLDSLPKTFKTDIYSMQCMASGVQEKKCEDNEDLDLRDRNWTWKSKDFKYAPGRSRQMPGYIGSYAMDNLSMSLHCIYHTTSAKEAMLYCANMRGDSDSVCAVVGQMSGAIYGLEGIPANWITAVERWDGGGSIMLRAYKLYKAGVEESKKPKKKKGSKGDSTLIIETKKGKKEEKGSGGTSMELSEELSEEAGAASGAAKHLKKCSHATQNIKQWDLKEAKDLEWKCKTCGLTDAKNLLVDMVSHEVSCGRYANGCMLKNHEETKHQIAMCHGDLSFWCYGCNNYINHLTIKPVYTAYNTWHKVKFGEPLPVPFEG